MQSVGRSCIRAARLVSQSAAGSAESPQVIRHAQASANSGLCSCSIPLQSVQPQFEPHGQSFSSSASAHQIQISPETKDDWPYLSHAQRKDELKPDKNRNHFKRMWKKDLQIKHAHQTRKRQQAAADRQRQGSLQKRWQAGAALWRGQTGDSAVADSQ